MHCSECDVIISTETIENACPICDGDVSGSDDSLFYCKVCNILFRRSHLKAKP